MPVVSLRPVEDGDLPLFFEWQSDEESYRMAAVPTRDAEAFAAHWARNRSNPENYMSTIVADGAVVGNALSWMGDEGRMVGYWIGKPYWGRGIASTALRLYLDDVEQHRPLLASVAEHNAGSRRVLEKAGFQFVARELVDDGTQGEGHVVAGVAVGDREDVEVVDLLPPGLEGGEREALALARRVEQRPHAHEAPGGPRDGHGGDDGELRA